jgi:hypothetical protein
MAIMRIYVDAVLRKADADLTQNHWEVGYARLIDNDYGNQEFQVVDQYLTEEEAEQWVDAAGLEAQNFADKNPNEPHTAPFMRDMLDPSTIEWG